MIYFYPDICNSQIQNDMIRNCRKVRIQDLEIPTLHFFLCIIQSSLIIKKLLSIICYFLDTFSSPPTVRRSRAKSQYLIFGSAFPAKNLFFMLFVPAEPLIRFVLIVCFPVTTNREPRTQNPKSRRVHPIYKPLHFILS